MSVSWNFIAARGEHIVDSHTYELLYGAPNFETDPVGWRAWMDEMNRRTPNLPGASKEFHIDDCPGCWADQWREDAPRP